MNPETDEQAQVRAVLDQRPAAFEKLVRDYQRLCWHIVFRMVGNPDDARDLCQDVFLQVHRQLHQFRFECPLKAWIGRIAYTMALRHLERRRAAKTTYLEDEAGSMESVAQESSDFDSIVGAQNGAHVRAAVAALPAVPRTLVTLYHLEEVSIPEIAIMTGMSEGTIKSHLFRARETLRERLLRRGVVGS